ncbi:hypothetical protein ACFL16_02785 [Patescibacteria group bacterium]
MNEILLALTEAVETFDFWIAFLVFVAYVVMDGLYAKYTIDVSNYNAVRAANVGTIIHFLLVFGVLNYTQNWLYVFPLAIGSWIGTYYTIKKEKLKRK